MLFCEIKEIIDKTYSKPSFVFFAVFFKFTHHCAKTMRRRTITLHRGLKNKQTRIER